MSRWAIRALAVISLCLGIQIPALLLRDAPDAAHAAIYWANSNTIGRANLDGSNADPDFISHFQSQSINQACGVAVNSSHIYWGDAGHNAIGRANIDGSEPNYAFITGADDPCGVAIDDRYVYWANHAGFNGSGTGAGSIGRARLDGTEQNQEFIPATTSPCGVAVNNKFIYWTSSVGKGLIRRALLAGPTKEPPLVEGIGDYDLCGVAVNETHIFWGGFGEAVGRAELDGAEPTATFISGAERPCGVAVDATHIYLSELILNAGLISRADLAGTLVERGVIAGQRAWCGVAVDSLYAPPLPPPYAPPPRPAPCLLRGIKLNKSKGSAVVGVDAEAQGEVSIETPGLDWRVLTGDAPPWLRSARRWKVKVWPGAKGRAARRIRRQLRQHGRARINLRIGCVPQDNGLLPASESRKVVLRRARPARTGRR